MAFHSSFERCVSRVIYKTDWATARPAIMRHNEWGKCSSEVMIRCTHTLTSALRARYSHASANLSVRLVGSGRRLRAALISNQRDQTPAERVRPRFHRIAIFCAALALSFGVEIVVFSPARRASRKLLERMVE